MREVARLLLRNKLKRLDRMLFLQRFSGLSLHQVANLVGFRSLQMELTLVLSPVLNGSSDGALQRWDKVS